MTGPDANLTKKYLGLLRERLIYYGKYSIQTMIFWSLRAFIWFKNIEKMLLQMTSGFMQPASTVY
jgi:hypothetical protein